MSTISRVFLPVMGFTQTTRGKTGMETLWCRLRELSSQATWVLPPMPWNTDAEAVALLIDRNIAADAEIFIMPYSWGAGQFFEQFARTLEGQGRAIRHAILCDGVYRSAFLPTFIPFNPFSLTRLPRLDIPANVQEVTWFFQRNNRPSGHVPKAKDPNRTLIHPGTQLNLRHEQMDDSPEFHDAVCRLAGLPA